MSLEDQRIPPIPRSQWTDEVRDVFAFYEGRTAWENGASYNIMHVFPYHPQLAMAWLNYNTTLTRGVLPGRLRELVILRVAHCCKSEYEWTQHVVIGAKHGVEAADLAALQVGPEDPHWSELDRQVLRAIDQLTLNGDIDDAAWQDLAAHFSWLEILELLFLAGTYGMLSKLFRAIRLQVEAPNPA